MMADNNKDDMIDDLEVDDLDFSDLDLENDGFAEDDRDDQQGSKDKKSITSYAVYGLIGIVVLGVVAWQLDLFGGKEPEIFRAENIPMTAQAEQDAQLLPASNDPFNVLGTPETLTDSAVSNDNGEQSPLIFDAMQPADSLSSDTLSDEEALAMAQDQAQNSDFTAVTPVDNTPNTIEGDTLPMPAPVVDVVIEEPVIVTQDAPIIETSTPLAQEEAPLVTEVASSPATATTIGAEDLNNIMATLESITNRIESMETRIDNNNAQKTSAPSTESSQEIKALTNTVKALEKKLSTLETKSTSAPKASPVAQSAPEKTATSNKTAKKKTLSKWDQPYDDGAILDKPIAEQAPTPSPSRAYSLRAAQPNKAYIDDGSGAILEVSIGTTIPNMGQVTDISQSNGQWMINTTNGIIK